VIRYKLGELPTEIMIPAGHFYRLFDADGNLIAHTGVCRPHDLKENVQYHIGRQPYEVQLYTEPLPGDNDQSVKLQITRGDRSLRLFAHGHERSHEAVSNVGIPTVRQNCSCGWSSAIGTEDQTIKEWSRHEQNIDWDQFGKVLEDENL
jgi:hypothetical protein